MISLLLAFALVGSGVFSDQSPGEALIRFVRSLSAAGFVPGRRAIRHIVHRELFGTFKPAVPRSSDVDRWTSNDGSCFAEFVSIGERRPLAKIMFGCRFTTRVDAERFLREVSAAFGGPIVPPLGDTIPSECHHRAVIVAGLHLIGVELHIISDDNGSLTTVVITEGRRIVIGE